MGDVRSFRGTVTCFNVYKFKNRLVSKGNIFFTDLPPLDHIFYKFVTETFVSGKHVRNFKIFYIALHFDAAINFIVKNTTVKKKI